MKKRILLIIGSLTALTLAGAAAFVFFGAYNISALAQHTPPVYRLLQYAMVRSVAARTGEAPADLHERDWSGRGLVLYEQNCRQCHGAPGVGPEPFSLGMVPAPTAIAAIARKRQPPEIFWVVKHGIKMSGMPAWKYRLSDAETWDLVAFVDQITNMTVDEYAALREQAFAQKQAGALTASTSQYVQPDSSEDTRAQQQDDSESRVERGRVALQQYNCTSCHSIPGVTAARNHVGPPLGGITRRAFIAGVLKYSDDNLVRWIRFPQQVDADTTMPNLQVSETHAREMLAYFKSIDGEG